MKFRTSLIIALVILILDFITKRLGRVRIDLWATDFINKFL